MTLSTSDFDAFHRAVHRRAPFEWQRRLLDKIVGDHKWPRILDLPTGSGKTTCIDIAVFALALDAASAPDKRWCPRRIAMVVDRRVVVDQAAERGRKLYAAVSRSDDPAVVEVRRALMTLAGDDAEPLGVFTLRGGIPKDDGWARAPDQPLVIASTVDQLGSRLLIQGYGVSDGMRPVHAGLAGNDMLILLDEVHLSQPFKETLDRLDRLRKRFTQRGLPRRFQFAFLSATPGETDEASFALLPGETAPNSPLGPRLHAKKPTRLVDVLGRDEVAVRVADEAVGLLGLHRVVASVVNRVDTARAVAARLRSRIAGRADVVLLTGRMRPLDRDDVLARYRARIATGARTRGDDEPQLVVVGTQCIEAGADFDFDAMVTESASFDALRQRFGRVDRLGEYGKAEGVIVHDAAAVIPKLDSGGKAVRKEGQVVHVPGDPLYGDTIVQTMKWLVQQRDGKAKKSKKRAEGGNGTIDFGSRSLGDAPPELLAPKAHAPTLLPAYLDLWSQTAPASYLVPEPGLFLHGPRSGPEDVQVVWRVDVDESSLDASPSDLVAAVGAIPPCSLEAISLPFVVARRWLAGDDSGVLQGAADIELRGDVGDANRPRGGRRALRWRRLDSEVVDAADVRPGDTLVVPSTYGGIDPASGTFDPQASSPVADLAERASLFARGRPLLRLHPRVLAGLGLDLDPEDQDVLRRALRTFAASATGWTAPWARGIASGTKARRVPWADGDGWLVLSGPRVRSNDLRAALAGEFDSIEDGAEATTDDDDSPHVGAEVELAAHCGDVERYARAYAERLGLSEDLVEDLTLAAWLHDIGKADTRFQRMLRGGSEIAYYRDEDRLLAKSGMPPGSKAEHRRAQQASGYPRGTRHEVQSVAMLEAAREQLAAKADDLDLVLHLVASHHGHCRPFAPATHDADPVEVSLGHTSEHFGALSFGPTTSANGMHRLDSPLADRFWSLVDKYGWHELCWLEAILRLADHRASEAEAGDDK